MRDLYAAASTLLTAVVDQMTALGVTLPATQYVAPGAEIAYDGEQLTVNVGRVYSGQPNAQGFDPFVVGQFAIMAVELQVVIVRYTPDIQDNGGGSIITPSTDDIQASAQQTLADVTALAQALINIKAAGTMGPTGAYPTTAGPVTSHGPEGGVVATIGLFTMPLL